MQKQPNTTTAAKAKELTPEELNAKIALTGNLADLSPEQRMRYYERYCQHLGLDPITRPFDLLTTFEENGAAKTILYANASCSAQLADKREVTYSKPETEYNEKLGLLTIHVQAMMPTNTAGMIRSCWRRGVSHIEGLKGKRLENAIKKAETQAHRRATLALCGVAMPDESEIEDIPGAHTSPLQMDSATGGIYEKIGALLKARNLEDSSGARRFILDGLASGNYQGVAQMIGIPVEKIQDLAQMVEKKAAPAIPTAKEIFDDPRPLPDAPLPEAWTADTAAREIADQEIANKLKAGLNAIAAEVKAEAPPEPPSKTEIRETIEENLNKAVEPDPVPALKPTLTPSQQKVSDAVMLLFKEHNRAKAETLLVIEKLLGRPVKASKDLTDEEAERVFAHLQTLAAQFADEAKPAPAPVKYDRKNPAHNPELAKAIEEAFKKLAILKDPFGPLSDLIKELVEREFGRTIANRYELRDGEAQSVLEYLQNRILEKECEQAVKADEV